MTKLGAYWRMARMAALGLAVAMVVGVVAVHPAEARGYWHWNGGTWVWLGGPAYGPGYYPPPAYYPPYPYYPAYYGGYGYGYPGPYYYGPSVGFSFHIR
jgi:hypothetical protein